MTLKVMTPFEIDLAQVTLVWSFSSVNPFMNDDTKLVAEQLGAESALKLNRKRLKLKL